MGRIEFSKRLNKLPPYLFAEIDREKNVLKQKGIPLIDLSVGDPDILAPKGVVDILYKSAKIKENQKYALDRGKMTLRKAIKKWSKKRFNVLLDENEEILPLIGSKDGLTHFPLAFVNKGDYVIIPSPGYPGYRGASTLAGAKIFELPLREENFFLPCLNKIPLSVRNKTRLIYLNYPNNPTTALADKNFLIDLVRFCSKYGIIIAYDNAYSEIYFGVKPLSIFEVKGAREIALEFHSLSKTFCMTGFRIGWACGNRNLLKGLLKVKTNLDSGIFSAIQDAAAYALDERDGYVSDLRRTIKNRRDLFVKGLKRLDFGKIWAESTFYVWAKLPGGFKSSVKFSKSLLNKGIVSTPGIGFGRYGEGFVRFSLTVDRDILNKALTFF